MKTRTKITIIVVGNREPYYFIIIYVNVKKSHYPYFLIRCWLQLLTTNERSSYYKVYGGRTCLPRSRVEIGGSKDWYVSNIILYWSGKVDSVWGSTLPKIRITFKSSNLELSTIVWLLTELLINWKQLFEPRGFVRIVVHTFSTEHNLAANISLMWQQNNITLWIAPMLQCYILRWVHTDSNLVIQLCTTRLCDIKRVVNMQKVVVRPTSTYPRFFL